ncbi:MAG: hypothetical protein V4725_20315, partial [Bacteroidota bacterium]
MANPYNSIPYTRRIIIGVLPDICNNKLFMMRNVFNVLLLLISFCTSLQLQGQSKGNDVTTPLHALKPDYPFKNEVPNTAEIKTVLDRLHAYLDVATPFAFVNRNSGEPVTSLQNVDTNTVVKPGDFRLASYEWGVTYAAMLQAGEATGDSRYTDYT